QREDVFVALGVYLAVEDGAHRVHAVERGEFWRAAWGCEREDFFGGRVQNPDGELRRRCVGLDGTQEAGEGDGVPLGEGRRDALGIAGGPQLGQAFRLQHRQVVVA